MAYAQQNDGPGRSLKSSASCSALLTAALFIAAISQADLKSAAAESPARFEAVWPDGTREASAIIDDWTDDGRRAAIAGRKLFAGPTLVRTLRNLEIPHRPVAGPCVEFLQGDVLPGEVTGPAIAEGVASDVLLFVRPNQSVDLPGAKPRDAIRVHSEWIRRLVWTRAAREEFRPGTAYRADGSSLNFQRHRFHADGIHLLTENKIVTFGWNELAELHLPAADWWTMHSRELAVISPDLQSHLVRIHATEGMRLTTSLARFQIWNRSERPTLINAYHVVQPAWSLDVLCVRRSDVRQYVVSSPFEVPLSAIEPSQSQHHPAFSRLLAHWTRDANITGGPLISGGQEFAWGIGVCGGHDLEYPLTKEAGRLTTAIGLDRAAGLGGCIRGRIEWTTTETGSGSPSQVLNETAVVMGSSRTRATVSVEIPHQSGPGRLRLVSDPMLTGVPTGADRFDIRDYCDWLEPRLELRRDAWTARVTEAIPSSYASLAGWTIDGVLNRDWKADTLWNPTSRPYPAFDRAWVLSGFPVSLKRTIKVPQEGSARWRIGMRRAGPAAPPCRLDAIVDQRPIAKFPLPEIIPAGPASPPLTIDLTGFAGRELVVELRLVPVAGSTRVVWDGAEFERPVEQPGQ